ncbi:MAG: chemotaxis-specific protein-glutamate methyltransferase CheB [Gemmatimonadales bacterium]
MIRVLVAEDSVTVREMLVAILTSDPEIAVVAQASNGAEAVELAKQFRPDLITMDVHMPVLDGLAATKEIMIRAPTPILIVSSSSSAQEVDLALNAMRAGALMVVPKPENPLTDDFNGRRTQFVALVKSMAAVKVVRRWDRSGDRARPPAVSVPPSGAQVRLVTIGASTGGPMALQLILSGLPGDFPVPIVVVQHIAAGFTPGLADWLSASSDLRVKVADAGESLAAHTVYLAPDGRHTGVTREGRVALMDAPPIGGLRPSATHLFASAAQTFGSSVAAVILTGMGSDGVEGLSAVKAAGGRVLAQDEASSVVYGMPREAVAAGAVDTVLPLDAIAPYLVKLVARSGPAER